ncbi:hypothetical protein ACN28I_32725 [Archangium gephyra]|uniref:hypothetical protein n=1 Tax=Archangium gephyra TaxID=48 RepID=UPI003B7B7C89
MPELRDAGRSTLSLLFRSPLGISVLCPLSLAATGLFLGVLWEPNRVRLWHLLMGVQTALWVVSVFVVLDDYRSHRLDRPGSRSEWTAVVLCTLLAGGMSAFPFLGQIITQQWETLPVELEAMLQLPHLRARFSILGLLSAAFATLHTAGMLNEHVQLLASPREPAARRGGPKAAGVDDEVLRYQRLRSRLERFLVFSAATIGTATLSFGAFRDLLTEFAPSLGEVMDP